MALSKLGCQVVEAATADAALRLARETSFDIVLLDLRMPGMDGMDALPILRQVSPRTAVVIITGYATIECAVDAMKRGAADFLPKPFTPEQLRNVVGGILEKRTRAGETFAVKGLIPEHRSEVRLIGNSPAMRSLMSFITQVGPTDSTVLILGESGSGKELVAHALHSLSLRRDKPFVAVDCCALVGTLFESELFGHVKGSFTGALATKHGRFELANGGTIFFDEIGNLSLDLQAKLLRVLQEREFSRVGSTQPTQVDVRVIAATNKDLLAATRAGAFREDLYYRLSVLPITVPPLRRRREDIPLLAEYFIEKYSRKRKREIRGITADAMGILMAYDWPGNVRELENAIERAVVLAANETLDRGLFAHFSNLPHRSPESEPSATLEALEKEHILQVLAEVGGNKTLAAKRLGIDRKTLWRKLRGFGLSPQPERAGSGQS
ncbi:MAG: sigma-54-dependent Fis family transcriptional regulator, partial [Planctomycetes bacterium]|nr:sigma-54-dependent Fis family transcriptional regulator [Planctomycetota bacterium]